MHKIYLEFPLPTLTEPTLLHKSYKWDPLRPERHAIGRYVRYPLLSYQETTERVRDLLAGCRRPGAFEMADELLRLAMPRLKGSFHYLEVTEEGNPRKSFDVNLYSASLTMGDIRPLLLRMAERYSLSIEEFGARLESVAQEEVRPSRGRDRQGGEGFFHHPLRRRTAPGMMEKESSDAQSRRGFGKDRLFLLRGHPPLVRVQQRLRHLHALVPGRQARGGPLRPNSGSWS